MRNKIIFGQFGFVQSSDSFKNKKGETKRAKAFEFPTYLQAGPVLYKLVAYVKVENRFNNTEQRYTRPALNETVFTGIEAVYQPVERFGGKFNGVTLSPYGRTIQENDEKSFEKVLSQKKAEEDVEDTDNEVIDETTVTPLPLVSSSVKPTASKTYEGKIETLAPNQIFVFGSNPEGRHGLGTAQLAKNKFGAKYGQGRGLQGQSYGLVTKNLTPGFTESSTGITYEKAGEKSLSPQQIIENIDELYQTAMANPTKEFVVAYTVDRNLNGYTPKEMADMFNSLPIPDNVIFNREFKALFTTESVSLTGNQKQAEQGAQAIANLNMLSASTADADVASRDNVINWFVGLKTKRDSNDATWKQDYAQFYLNLEESNSELAKMFKTPGSPMLIGMPKSGIPLENVIDMLRNMNPTQVAELDKYRC
jgi:hypothetical protein